MVQLIWISYRSRNKNAPHQERPERQVDGSVLTEKKPGYYCKNQKPSILTAKNE